ncbi:MAG TPA: DNA alkylation response protein, partial [Xanthobacteraceae bacterium]|nr:DNA alkylation response protein [Xanthobacteraceae bacterium]
MTVPQRFDPHEVFNQSPPYEDIDLFASDHALRDAVAANGAADEAAALSEFGRRWGSAEMLDQARLANENGPRLKTYDAKGFRRDVVEFHPAYHRLMTQSMADGLHASTWRPDGTRASEPAEVARAARIYMTNQIEAGHNCPITMTRASVGALAAEPALRAQLMPKIVGRAYDGSFRPWWEKTAMTLGMGMTEKQGGTDVRANLTRAVAVRDGYAVTGH